MPESTCLPGTEYREPGGMLAVHASHSYTAHTAQQKHAGLSHSLHTAFAKRTRQNLITSCQLGVPRHLFGSADVFGGVFRNGSTLAYPNTPLTPIYNGRASSMHV